MTALMTISQSHYASMDDAGLAQQARTDPQAFAELYRRHVRSIYCYHLAHTGNIKDAEDLTSQTFMAALEGIRSFRGMAPYITWLIGIASRKRALFFRGKKPEVSLDAVLHIPTPSLPTDRAAARRFQRLREVVQPSRFAFNAGTLAIQPASSQGTEASIGGCLRRCGLPSS